MGPNHRAIEREIAARQRRDEEAREAALAPERDRAMAAIAIWNAESRRGQGAILLTDALLTPPLAACV
jgi:hypothetical protein